MAHAWTEQVLVFLQMLSHFISREKERGRERDLFYSLFCFYRACVFIIPKLGSKRDYIFVSNQNIKTKYKTLQSCCHIQASKVHHVGPNEFCRKFSLFVHFQVTLQHKYTHSHTNSHNIHTHAQTHTHSLTQSRSPCLPPKDTNTHFNFLLPTRLDRNYAHVYPYDKHKWKENKGKTINDAKK